MVLGKMIAVQLREITTQPSVPTVTYVLFTISSLLVILAALMLIEAVRALLPARPTTGEPTAPVPVPVTA